MRCRQKRCNSAAITLSERMTMVPHSRLRAWMLDWGWILLGALAVELTAFGLGFAIPGHSSEMLPFVTDLQVLPLRLGATLLAWRAYRPAGPDGRTRRAWLLL